MPQYSINSASNNKATSLINADTTKYPNGHSYYIFLIIYLVGLSAFGSFVNDMYIPSLPEMTHYFSCSIPTVQLGLTFGMIGLGLGQVVLGPVSDKYGRKPVLRVSIAIFVVAAIVGIFSPNIHFFLWCRLVQGLGASAAYFLARTIPADIYAGRMLAQFMAVIGAINGFAPASAPVIGGILAHTTGWKGVFWVLAGFATLMWILSFRLKESLPQNERFNGKLIDSFKEYRGLIRNRRFMTHVMLKGTSLGVLFSYVSASPFIFQDHFGWSAMSYGFFMGFNAAFIAFGSILALKFKYIKKGAYIGAWILLLSTIGIIIALNIFNSFWMTEVILLPMVLGMGMIFTVANTLAMNEGRENAGGASAILGVMGYVFGATLAPLVGIGNVIHSTSIVIGIMSIITLIFAYLSNKMTPDPNMQKDNN